MQPERNAHTEVLVVLLIHILIPSVHRAAVHVKVAELWLAIEIRAISTYQLLCR